MRRFLIPGSVLLLPLLALSGTAFSFSEFFSPSREGPPTRLKQPSETRRGGPLKVTSTPKGVTIRVVHQPLKKVLQAVANQTDIRFRVSPTLAEQPISADIRARDWKSGVRLLLKNYSHITLWNEASKRTDVVLLEGNPYQPESRPQTRPAGSRKAQNLARSPDRPQNKVPRIPQDIPITSRVDLSETQLRELAKGPYRSPLPSNLLKNSKIRQFLAQFRVNSEEDLQDIRKAMRVRREARKRLRLLIRESSESRDT